MNWRTCGFKWESGNVCEMDFHTCEHAVNHTNPHRCGDCGEELKVGSKWEIGSSIDHVTGKRKQVASKPAPAKETQND